MKSVQTSITLSIIIYHYQIFWKPHLFLQCMDPSKFGDKNSSNTEKWECLHLDLSTYILSYQTEFPLDI